VLCRIEKLLTIPRTEGGEMKLIPEVQGWWLRVVGINSYVLSRIGDETGTNQFYFFDSVKDINKFFRNKRGERR